MTDLPLAECAIVLPGDTLIVRLDTQSAYDAAVEAKQQLADFLPEDVKILFIHAAQMIQIGKGSDT
jgi:hypothetical protein